MQLLLSTSTIDLRLDPRAFVKRWQQLVDGAGERVDGVALGPRLQPARQREVLEVLRRAGHACFELAHPFVAASHWPAASPATTDREERLAAARQVGESLDRAADGEVPRVVLYPARIDLQPGEERLRRLFELDMPLPLELIGDQREALVAAAMDSLRWVLDRALEAAARRGVTVALPGPCPWPHQLPRWKELQRLQREFEGAPLQPTFFMDWSHAATQLQTDDGFPAATSAVRLADACGLTLRLPLGSGEACWPPIEGSDSFGAVGDIEQATLTLRQGCSPLEVGQSLRWIITRM